MKTDTIAENRLPGRMHRHGGRYYVRSALHIFVLILITVVLFLPLVALLFMSFKSDNDLLFYNYSLFPHDWTFQNYVNVFNLEGGTQLDFFGSIGNTVLITVCSLVGTVFTSALCAYGFTRFRVRENSVVFSILLAGTLIPSQVLQIPMYEVYYQLGWIDTFYPFIVPAFFGGGILNIYLMREFVRGISPSMFEAAEIDGAGELRMFFQLALPLSLPVLVTVAIFTFQGTWNDFYGPLLYINSPEKYTLALAVYQFSTNFNSYTGSMSTMTPWNLIAAVNILSMLPIIILYSFGQKYFIEGISLGSVKG